MVRKSPLSILVLAVVVLFVSVSAPAQEMRVALVDFVVHSDDPKYTYLGKGISEMIAMELANSPGVALVDRKQRTELMEEMKFALSGLADDTERKMEVGRMLAADYIVFGEIVDMAPQLLISIRVTGVDSGEVVYQDNVTERPGRYEYISGYFASKILDHFDVRVARSTEKKVEEKKEKQEEAVVAFSRALAAYDKGEEEEAKKELVEAKRIDPDYEAAQTYLDKLITNTTKFKVKTEPFYSYQNPAYLGIMETDNIQTVYSSQLVPFYIKEGIWNVNASTLPDTSKAIEETDAGSLIGYAFPIGERMGIKINGTMFIRRNVIYKKLSDNELEKEDQFDRTSMGAIIDIGYKLSHSIAIGAGLTLYPAQVGSRAPWEFQYYEKDIKLAGNIGFLYRSSEESFIYDSRIAWGNESFDIVDIETNTMLEEVHIPIYLENTFTFARNERQTFFIIKQLNDISVDRVYYFGRILPAAEHFFSDSFSLRAGIEGSFAQLNDSSLFGYGAMGGVTFRIIPWGMDIDFNISYRLRPSRMKEEFLYTDILTLLTISFNDVWISRE